MSIVLSVAVSIAALAASAGSLSASAPSCLLPPVDAPVVDRYRPGACPYCAGNRGLQYDVAPGTPVRAAAAGIVSFSGPVAGTYYVVVRHADGRRATYGQLDGSHLGPGNRIAAGASVGRSAGGLHFGLRRGDEYVDPEPFLGRLRPRPHLVPTDGTPRRAAPRPRLVCPAVS